MVVFFSCNVFVSFWYWGNVDLKKTIWKVFSLFSFSERVCVELLLFFSLKCLVEFANKMIWALGFLCWELYKHKSYFLNKYRIIHVVCFFLSKSLFFVECVDFFCFQIYWHNVVQMFLFIFLMSVKSAYLHVIFLILKYSFILI